MCTRVSVRWAVTTARACIMQKKHEGPSNGGDENVSWKRYEKSRVERTVSDCMDHYGRPFRCTRSVYSKSALRRTEATRETVTRT